MAAHFEVGDTAYLIESNRTIREVSVVKCNGDLYVIRFANGGGIQVKSHRLFISIEEAEQQIPTKKYTENKMIRSPYDYPH